MTLRQFLISARTQQTSLEAAGDLILRVVFGLSMALSHGMAKIPPSARFVEGVMALGFPAPYFFAWCATAAEFLGGVLLALGLFTRPAAAGLAFTMAIAGFVRHAADPFSRKEMAFLYLAVGVSYLLAGAGRFSIDAVLSRKRR